MSRIVIPLLMLALTLPPLAGSPEASIGMVFAGVPPEIAGSHAQVAEVGDRLGGDRRSGPKKERGKSKTPTCFGRKATIKDHSGVITGTSGNDVIVGDAGPNRIFLNTGLKSGVDLVCAGSGDDFITKECCDGVLIAMGGAGNDQIIGGPGGDVLFGGHGDDSLHQGPPDDTGGDLLLGEAGTDTLLGDGENDTCQQNRASEAVSC